MKFFIGALVLDSMDSTALFPQKVIKCNTKNPQYSKHRISRSLQIVAPFFPTGVATGADSIYSIVFLTKNLQKKL